MSGWVRGERLLDLDEPLEDALPEAVTPEYAVFLVVSELLELLIRRSRERDALP